MVLLLPILQAIAIRIGIQRISAVLLLVTVIDAVTIGVRLGRIGTVLLLGAVIDTIAVGVLRVRIGLGILLRGIIHGLAGVGVDLGVQLLAVLDTVTIGIGILRIRVARLTVRIGLMVLERILRTMHLVTIVHAVLVGVRIQRISTVVLLLPILQAIAISVIVLRIGTVLLLVVILDAVVVIVVILDVRRAVTIGVQLELGIGAIGNRTGVLRVGHDDRNLQHFLIGSILAGRRHGNRDGAGLRIDAHRVALGSGEALVNGEHRAAGIRVALVARRRRHGLARRCDHRRILRLGIKHLVRRLNRHRDLRGVLGPVRIGDRHGLLDDVTRLGGAGNRHRDLARVRIHRHRRAIGNTELRTLGQLVVTRLGNLHALARLALTRLIRRIVLGVLLRLIQDGHHGIDRLRRTVRVGDQHIHRVRGIGIDLGSGAREGTVGTKGQVAQTGRLGIAEREVRAGRNGGIRDRSGNRVGVELNNRHRLVLRLVQILVVLLDDGDLDGHVLLGAIGIGDRHGSLDLGAGLDIAVDHDGDLARIRVDLHRRVLGNGERGALGQLVVTGLRNLHGLARLARLVLIRRIMGLAVGLRVLDRDLDGLLLGGAIRIGHLHGHRVIGILVHLRGGTGDGAGLLIDRETGQAAILGHPELRAFRHCGIGHRSGDPDRIALVHSHVLVCGIVDVPVLLVGHDEVRHGPGGGLVGERGHDGDIDLGARLGISGSDDSHHTGRLIDGDLVALWSSVGPRNAERFIRC